jgi:hypothetical protein
MLNFDNWLGMAKCKLSMLLSPPELAQGILLQRLDNMLDLCFGCISYLGPVMMPLHKHEFWVPTGSECPNTIQVCSFRLSNFLK